jgi:hypothetical protein
MQGQERYLGRSRAFCKFVTRDYHSLPYPAMFGEHVPFITAGCIAASAGECHGEPVLF